MALLIAATIAVSFDEPAFSLAEVNLQSPGSRGWRRYQLIQVMRNDRPAEYRENLGPAKKFSADQFCILGGVQNEITGRFEILHTVGELRDIADGLREKRSESLVLSMERR